MAASSILQYHTAQGAACSLCGVVGMHYYADPELGGWLCSECLAHDLSADQELLNLGFILGLRRPTPKDHRNSHQLK